MFHIWWGASKKHLFYYALFVFIFESLPYILEFSQTQDCLNVLHILQFFSELSEQLARIVTIPAVFFISHLLRERARFTIFHRLVCGYICMFLSSACSLVIQGKTLRALTWLLSFFIYCTWSLSIIDSVIAGTVYWCTCQTLCAVYYSVVRLLALCCALQLHVLSSVPLLGKLHCLWPVTKLYK